MKRIHLGAAVAACLCAGTAMAQQPQQQQPSQQQQQPMGSQDMPRTRGATQVVSVNATVEKVDLSKHELTLKGPQGNHFIVQVPESVQKLDELKPGDPLSIDFYQSVALTLKKQPGPIAESARTFAARPSGNMPGGLVGQEIDAVAKVTKVDASKGMVMIEGPNGKEDTINVQDPQMKADLKKLKPGDAIQVTYTEAMAISATKKS